MKTIREILALERSHTPTLHLHCEGIFYRVYEYSAYLFVHHLLDNYKVHLRYYKNVNREVVYLGFPVSSLLSLQEKINASLPATLSLVEVSRQEQGDVIWQLNGASPVTAQELALWKQEIKETKECLAQEQAAASYTPTVIFTPISPSSAAVSAAPSASPSAASAAQEPSLAQVSLILKLIQDFDLNHATGVMCMNFIEHLQRMVRSYALRG